MKAKFMLLCMDENIGLLDAIFKTIYETTGDKEILRNKLHSLVDSVFNSLP